MRWERGVHTAHGRLRVCAGAGSVRGVWWVAGTRAVERVWRTQHVKLVQLSRSGTVVRKVPSDPDVSGAQRKLTPGAGVSSTELKLRVRLPWFRNL